MTQTSTQQYRSRDAASFLVMGSFFVVLALLVLLGTFWSEDFSFPVVLNVVSGVVLLLVGLGLLTLARRVLQGASQAEDGANEKAEGAS